MSSRDNTFSFDFFEDEPPPPPAGGLRGRFPQRRGRGGAPAGPPAPLRPLLRLGALVFFVLFLLLVFSLLVASCAGTSRHSADAGYMNAVNPIAAASSADGDKAVTVLTSSGLDVSQMAQRMQGLAQAEQGNVEAAERLAPPGRLREENADLIEALQLRVVGLTGFAQALQSDFGPKASSSSEAAALSAEAYRLLASDIVWDDLFRIPAVDQLTRDGVGGVNVPESHFLANPNLLVTPDEMLLVVGRINTQASSKGSSCSGLHGTNLVAVQALGSGGKAQTLHNGPSNPLNTVTSNSSLTFRVTIHDGGNFQEVQIPVQLTIGRTQSAGGPITKTETVQLIDPGQDASAVFSDLGNVPFVSRTTVAVNVAKVCGETDIANNSATYNVVFLLPGG